MGIKQVDEDDALLRTCLPGSAGEWHRPRPRSAATTTTLLTVGLSSTATASLTDDIARGDVVVRPVWSDDVMREFAGTNPDVIAITADDNNNNDVHYNQVVQACLDQAVHRGSIVVSFGGEMTCTDYRTSEALNSHVDTDPDLDNPELGCLLRDLAEQAQLDRLT